MFRGQGNEKEPAKVTEKYPAMLEKNKERVVPESQRL